MHKQAKIAIYVNKEVSLNITKKKIQAWEKEKMKENPNQMDFDAWLDYLIMVCLSIEILHLFEW